MSQFSSQFPLEALQRSPRQKKHGDSTWSCTLLCQPTWNGMLVWFEQITKFESKQWNMTGMLPAISNYYHHLWVFLSHLCLWSWLCHVNHQSLKGSTCRRFYRHFVCVLDATVFGLGEDQPWRHETTAVFAPQHEIDVHTPGSGPNPVFLLTTYMLWWPHETSSSILTNKLPGIFGGFLVRWLWIIGRISSQLMA